MNILISQANKDGSFEQALFLKFIEKLPKPIKNNLNLKDSKAIPFPLAYLFFSHEGLDKQTGRQIIRVWKEQGFCEISRYHGLRVRPTETLKSDYAEVKAI